MRQIESLIGNRYGFLVVKEYSCGKSGKHYWLCLCDCKTKKVVRSDSLKDGSVKSCGCYNKNSKIKDEVGKITKKSRIRYPVCLMLLTN